MKSISIFYLIVISSLGAFAIPVEKGIHFEDGLNWEQVKAKAKRENKFIFVDCFATWCGPCRQMEKEVYILSKIGKFFNSHFISVKLQIDKTDRDNLYIKSWYDVVDTIQNEYGISSFPTFLFLSKDGSLVNRSAGFEDGMDFLTLAKNTTNSSFIQPYQEYYNLVSNYQKGRKDYSQMINMMDTARLLGQDQIFNDVSVDYIHYLENLESKDIYTIGNLKFLSNNIKSSKSRFFYCFLGHESMVDSIIQIKRFARDVIDRVIEQDEVVPFAHLTPGVFSTEIKESPEPEWKLLAKKIRDQYPGDYATRLVAKAKIQWLSAQQDWGNCAKSFTGLAKADSMFEWFDAPFYNMVCYGVIFNWSVEKEQIDAAINCMKVIVIKTKGLYSYSDYVDTYANLLYKAGRKAEALNWEREAKSEALIKKFSKKDVNDFSNTIDRMKHDKPTWPHYRSKNAFF